MIDRLEMTALVLAGGKSRRMGGRDKGLLPYAGGLLIERVVEGIRPQVGEVLISANRNREAYERLGLPVLADPLDDYQGPLAGFLAGLLRVRSNYLLTLPCDGPTVAPDLAYRLGQGLLDADADIAVAHDGERLQPVYTLMHRRVMPGLQSALAAGERKIDRWFPQQAWTRVDFSDVPGQFDNINTPQDYERAGERPLET